MNNIKFSHSYEKMPEKIKDEDTETILLEVLNTDKKELSDNFIRYDTGYFEEEFFNEEESSFKQYPLPPGKLLVLILLSYCGEFTHPVLWTTVRRWTTEKEKYYRSIRGEEVKIIIEEK